MYLKWNNTWFASGIFFRAKGLVAVFKTFPHFAFNIYVMTALELTGPINVISAIFSAMTLFYSLSDYLTFFGNISDIQYPCSKIVYCFLSSFVDVLLRLFSSAYIFSNLTFYAFILPTSYFFAMFLYVTFKESISFSLANVTFIFVSYITPSPILCNRTF